MRKNLNMANFLSFSAWKWLGWVAWCISLTLQSILGSSHAPRRRCDVLIRHNWQILKSPKNVWNRLDLVCIDTKSLPEKFQTARLSNIGFTGAFVKSEHLCILKIWTLRKNEKKWEKAFYCNLMHWNGLEMVGMGCLRYQLDLTVNFRVEPCTQTTVWRIDTS